jgi:hypothetical protein
MSMDALVASRLQIMCRGYCSLHILVFMGDDPTAHRLLLSYASMRMITCCI